MHYNRHFHFFTLTFALVVSSSSINIFFYRGCDRKLPRNDISGKIAATVATQRSGQFSDTRNPRVVAKELPNWNELVAEGGSGSLLAKERRKVARVVRFYFVGKRRAENSPRSVSRITNGRKRGGISVGYYRPSLLPTFRRQRAKIT